MIFNDFRVKFLLRFYIGKNWKNFPPTLTSRNSKTTLQNFKILIFPENMELQLQNGIFTLVVPPVVSEINSQKVNVYFQRQLMLP